MSSFTFNNVALRAFAVATPDHVIKADMSDRRMAKFVKQMGIEQVHISTTEQTPLDLGYVALSNALNQVGWEPQDIDLIIFDTQTPDFLCGTGNSFLLHHYLNLSEHCAAFDLPLGCTAFPYSLTVACSTMQGAEDVQRVALLMGDLIWYQYQDKATMLAANKQHLFGEATGVILLEKLEANSCPVIKTKLFAQGHGYLNLFAAPSFRDVWQADASHFVMPDGVTVQYQPGHIFSYMNGMAIHEFSTGKVVDCIKEQYGEAIHNYDFYVLHQANQQILNTITTRLKLDPNKVLISLDQYGNTSIASALTTICHKLHDIDRPVHIFNASFGIGLSWGFSDFVIEPDTVSTIIPTNHHFTEHCLQPVYDQQSCSDPR